MVNLLDQDIFLKGFLLLKENFEFSTSQTYIDFIYNSLKDKIDNETFEEIIMLNLEDVSKENWNRLYGYKGRPALKDWIDAFIITESPTLIQKSRQIQCSKTKANILEFYNDYPDWYLDYLEEMQERKNKKLTTNKQKQIYEQLK